MNGWRFAASRRWLGYLALVVGFAVACAFLASWQLSRRGEAQAEIGSVEANWDSAPRPIDEVLAGLGSFDADQKWTPVVLTGRYLSDDQLLVRGRPLGGKPGFEVLVPLELADGSIFVVDRGWLPAGNEQDEPDVIPAAPGGEVTVVVRLKAGEPILPGRSAPPGQLATVNLPTIADSLERPTYTGAYGLLATETPAAATRPTAAVRPSPDEGPHLSYAFQWVLFGVMAFIALGWAVRQEYRVRNQNDPAERERAAERAKRRAARPKSDAEIEDELLDA